MPGRWASRSKSRGDTHIYWELLFLECLVHSQAAVLDEGEAISGD